MHYVVTKCKNVAVQIKVSVHFGFNKIILNPKVIEMLILLLSTLALELVAASDLMVSISKLHWSFRFQPSKHFFYLISNKTLIR